MPSLAGKILSNDVNGLTTVVAQVDREVGRVRHGENTGLKIGRPRSDELLFVIQDLDSITLYKKLEALEDYYGQDNVIVLEST